MTAAEELRTAAAKLRDLATRTNITLDHHELQWTDLTAWAGPGQVSPMVWSQHAAAMHPGVGLALAAWLDCEAEIAAAAHLYAEREPCGWCGNPADHHALTVARALAT